jgi:chromosome segregation ATPase
MGMGSAAGTFAAQMRSNQALRHKSDEMAAMGAQVSQLERARRALLEEVTALSARNAQLEDACAGVPALQDALRQARHRSDVLLQLVGEKEEEVEAAQADMREVKALYRGQMDALLEVSLGRQKCVTSAP